MGEICTNNVDYDGIQFGRFRCPIEGYEISETDCCGPPNEEFCCRRDKLGINRYSIFRNTNEYYERNNRQIKSRISIRALIIGLLLPFALISICLLSCILICICVIRKKSIDIKNILFVRRLNNPTRSSHLSMSSSSSPAPSSQFNGEQQPKDKTYLFKKNNSNINRYAAADAAENEDNYETNEQLIGMLRERENESNTDNYVSSGGQSSVLSSPRFSSNDYNDNFDEYYVNSDALEEIERNINDDVNNRQKRNADRLWINDNNNNINNNSYDLNFNYNATTIRMPPPPKYM